MQKNHLQLVIPSYSNDLNSKLF